MVSCLAGSRACQPAPRTNDDGEDSGRCNPPAGPPSPPSSLYPGHALLFSFPASPACRADLLA
jgi:hypothetical protein